MRRSLLGRIPTSTLFGLAFTVPAALIAGALLTVHYAMAQRYLSEEGARYGEVLAEPILSAAQRFMRQGSLADLQAMIEDTAANRPVVDMALVGPDGRVIASSRRGWIGREDTVIADPGYLAAAAAAHRTLTAQHRLGRGGGQQVLVAPLLLAAPGPMAGTGGATLREGLLYVKFDQEERLREIAAGIFKRGLASAALILGFSLALLVWVRAILTRPILQVAAYLRDLSAGHAGRPPRPHGPLEVRQLIEDIESLADSLEAKEKSLLANERQMREVERMESVASLAGAMAHDFNNLLTGILGYARLLMDRVGPGDPIRRQLAAIEASAGRAADLTGRLLVFSKRAVSRQVPADLKEVFAPAILSVRDGLKPGVHLEVDCDADLWPASVDAEQMRRVLAALCANALEAMQWSGTLSLSFANRVVTGKECRARHEARPGRFVVVRVRDNGPGIDPEIRPRMFEPFVTSKSLVGGAGFGLATAYGLVKGHEGWIDVESEAGRGTAMTIHLPACESGAITPAETGAEQADAAVPGAVPAALPAAVPAAGHHAVDATPAAAPAAAAAESAQGALILAVDDESTVLALARDVLEVHGYRVVTARNGEEALRIFRERCREIDLVLLDLTMPVMGGVECFRKMREIDPRVRVVISSGFSSESTAADVLREGALDYLQKPYDIEHLARMVASALERDLPAPRAAAV
jgi:signal transduction histidine kinase/ActR/RegA family two-component response regulator